MIDDKDGGIEGTKLFHGEIQEKTKKLIKENKAEGLTNIHEEIISVLGDLFPDMKNGSSNDKKIISQFFYPHLEAVMNYDSSSIYISDKTKEVIALDRLSQYYWYIMQDYKTALNYQLKCLAFHEVRSDKNNKDIALYSNNVGVLYNGVNSTYRCPS